MSQRRRRSADYLVAIAAVLCAFAQRAAALDPAYLGELPDPRRIEQDFQGTDRLDTLALQVAALTRLNRLVAEMAGDRYYTPGKYPTPDETRAAAAIRAVAEPLGAAAEATFDPKARGADTPRARWRARVRGYESSDELYMRLMQLYFTPAFRAAHAAKLAEKQSSQNVGREEIERGRRALNGETEPVAPGSRTTSILVGVAMVALLLLGGVKLVRRPRISTKPPHRCWIGFSRYTFEAATGTIANYAHRETWATWRSSDATGRYFGEAISGYKEAHEEFTLETPAGAEPIRLDSYWPDVSTKVFENKVGHRATALSMTRRGERRVVAVFVHGQRHPEAHAALRVAVEELFPRPWWTVLPAVVLGYVIGDLAVASDYSGAIGALIAMPAWEIICRVLLSYRPRAFAGGELNRLTMTLAQDAAGVTR